VMETYLLERSRVTAPSKGERNFHAFYQVRETFTVQIREKLPRFLSGHQPWLLLLLLLKEEW
jgi:myosin heavy subunit